MKPDGLIVGSFGGGVDSVAMLLAMREAKLVPRALLMANPGSEKAATMAYLDQWVQPMLRAWGWPPIEVIERKTEGALRPPLPAYRGERRLETLREECMRTGALPSIAYGPKKCSQKFKAEPQRWWVQRQPWALSEWAAGRKLVRAIGYDFNERARVQRSQLALTTPAGQWEVKRFALWFPLFEARLTRAKCVTMIEAAGLPAPPKSSCTFCPANTLDEWKALREQEPERFAEAVAMSRNAAENIDRPDVVGLMRCNQAGRRQLHEWADGRYGLGPLFEDEPAPLACECST